MQSTCPASWWSTLQRPWPAPPRRRRAGRFPSARDCAESDLVSVGVSVGGLAHAVGVRLLLRRLQPPPGYLGHQGVEVINDDGVHGVAGMFRLLDDVHRPVFG